MVVATESKSDHLMMESENPTSSSHSELLRAWPGEELFAANLEALRERDRELAARLSTVEIPESVEPVIANDGSVTYRIKQADGRRRWLGSTSVPLIVAQANVKRTNLGSANLAMDSIGSGAEAKAVLQKMAPCQALFVNETDPLHLALVLRLRDFTTELQTGRLVLFLGDDPAQQIEAFLLANPGYNIVTQTITWAWRSDRENQTFAQQLSLAMQRCTETVIAQMNSLLQEQHNLQQQNQATALPQILQALQDPPSLRLLNCTQAYTPIDWGTSRDALAGAAQLGATVDPLVLDHPDRVSNATQLERLNRFGPHLILLVDMLRGDFSYPLPATSVCVSLLRQPKNLNRPPDQLLGENDFIFPAYQDQLAALLESGYPADRVIHLPLAAHTELYRPLESEEDNLSTETSEIVMVTDRCRVDPEVYQIKLPFQQQLWYAVAEEIRKGADTYHSAIAGDYCSRAQRRSQIDLQEEELQNLFLRLIRNCLGETVLRDTFAETLVRAGIDLKIRTWSAEPEENDKENPLGWFDSPVRDCVAGPIEHGEELNRLFNAAKIVLYVSSVRLVDQLILDAVAAGALVLVKAHPKGCQPDGIGDYFEIGKEIITFQTAADLVRKVRYYLSHDAERNAVARAAREKLLVRHSYKIRMQEMFHTIAEHFVGN
jgi:glycosyl transferase family 1